ncbi:MAG TPA: hypothetical protein VNC61_03900 [Acidimicrobiales bacterium]|nr:hypothetical protein [Acidimicrobiales bacterium]
MATAPEAQGDDVEAHRLAKRINDLLTKMGFPDGIGTEWWMLTPHEQLGGLTAAQGWSLGHHDEVRRLVEAYVSEQYAEALAANPNVAKRLLKQPTP